MSHTRSHDLDDSTDSRNELDKPIEVPEWVTDSPSAQRLPEGDDNQPLDQSAGNRKIDRDNLIEEIGSPHDDWEFYWGLKRFEGELDASRRAATATSFPDAVDALLAAKLAASQEYVEGEREMRELLEQKHGFTPYTTIVSETREDEESDPTQATGDASIEVVDTSRPTTFGTFAHDGYEIAADDHFEDVETEKEVRVQRDPAKGQETGYIDAVVDERYLFDFKTNYMKDWTERDATRHGHEHGAQVKSYVDSPDTPADAKGWIIASVPPDSPDVRKTYSEVLGGYGVGVKYSQSEQQDDVIAAMEEAIDEDDEEDQ
jgi:hypothetical protein